MREGLERLFQLLTNRVKRQLFHRVTNALFLHAPLYIPLQPSQSFADFSVVIFRTILWHSYGIATIYRSERDNWFSISEFLPPQFYVNTAVTALPFKASTPTVRSTAVAEDASNVSDTEKFQYYFKFEFMLIEKKSKTGDKTSSVKTDELCPSIFYQEKSSYNENDVPPSIF